MALGLCLGLLAISAETMPSYLDAATGYCFRWGASVEEGEEDGPAAIWEVIEERSGMNIARLTRYPSFSDLYYLLNTNTEEATRLLQTLQTCMNSP